MKLAIYSDLHCEFETWVPPKEAFHVDVVILAGYIHMGIKRVSSKISKSFDASILVTKGIIRRI